MVIVLLVFPVVQPVEVEGHWYLLVILFSPSGLFYSCLILMDSLRHVCRFLHIHGALQSQFPILTIVTELLNILDFRSLPCLCPDPRGTGQVSYKATSFLRFLQSGLENLRGRRLYNLCRQTVLMPSTVYWEKNCVSYQIFFQFMPSFSLCPTPLWGAWISSVGTSRLLFVSLPLLQAEPSPAPSTSVHKEQIHQPQPAWWPLLDALNFFSFDVGLPVLSSSPMRLLGSTPLIAPYQLFMFIWLAFIQVT